MIPDKLKIKKMNIKLFTFAAGIFLSNTGDELDKIVQHIVDEENLDCYEDIALVWEPLANEPLDQIVGSIWETYEKLVEAFKPSIIIDVTGGLVQSVTSDSDINITVIDYDTDGVEEGGLQNIPQGDGKSEEAYVYQGEVLVVDPNRVKEINEVLSIGE